MKSRIEKILGNILSRKHDAKIKIEFIKQEEKKHDNINKTGDISKE